MHIRMLIAYFLFLIVSFDALAEEHTCTVPDQFWIDGRSMHAQSNTVIVAELDFFTQIRWTFGAIVPNVVREDETGINVYRPGSIEEVLDGSLGGSENERVFLMCVNDDGSFSARLALTHTSDTWPRQYSDEPGVYIGTTIPLVVEAGTTRFLHPDFRARARLNDFVIESPDE